VDAVTKISVLWESSTDEHRRGLAQTLFEEIVYDLDTQRIVSFQLKAWADQFIVLRGSLYEVGNDGYKYTPKSTQDEQVSSLSASTFIQFIEQIQFPQRSILEHLLFTDTD
jgi:hypothetical protein